MQQYEAIQQFDAPLRAHFAHRSDVLISGGGYLRRDAADRGDFVPDCVFVDGVEDPKAIIWRNGYVTSEVGKPPDFVLEVASRSTGRRDYTVKREGYAGYGVGEYWRFDHTGGKYHDAPLAGDLLVNGEYRPLEIVTEPDGRHWGYSEALGLELWWDGGQIRFRDPATGEFLPTIEEQVEARRAAQEQAYAAQEQAYTAQEQAYAAQERAEAAELRAARLEAELRRLRDE